MNEAHREILCRPAASQDESPLFRELPGEVRSQIFALALADYPDPDPSRKYDTDTCYTRPSYFSPRRTDTELLRTCRAIYRETWHMPFTLTEQVHWVTETKRAPPGYDSHRLEQCLRSIAEQHSEAAAEVHSLRVFAQMFKLEEGHLASLLRTPFLRPRAITLTIRHADWWHWEEDAPLRFEGHWIREVCEALPSTVGEIHIELESLQRKKKQIDGIAQQMAERWFFKRPDGAVLYADVSSGADEVNQWRGTSIWHDDRWIRDETEFGKIDFYIRMVSFRPQAVVERRGGSISEKAKASAQCDSFDKDSLKLRLPGVSAIIYPNPSVWLHEVEEDGDYEPPWRSILFDSDSNGDDEGEDDEGEEIEGEGGEMTVRGKMVSRTKRCLD